MPLAAGGMARIYIGRSTGIGSFERHVVLKMITPERAHDLTAVNMFLDEARLAASLNHQNVAQVFEVGEDLGIHYLAMEYVHGQDLRALLAKRSEEHTSELQSRENLVCRLLLEKKKHSTASNTDSRTYRY